MKKKVSVLIIIAILTTFTVSTVYALDGETNYQSETNKLNSVAQVLGSISIRLESMALCQMSRPDPIGVANRLEAMANQLHVCYTRVNRVFSYPPDPYLPDPLVDALTGVYCESEHILSIGDGMSYPPDPCYDPAREALGMVMGYGMDIMDTMLMYLGDLPAPSCMDQPK